MTKDDDYADLCMHFLWLIFIGNGSLRELKAAGDMILHGRATL